MKKILVYGGLGLTILAVIECILFIGGILSKQFDNIPEPKITEIIIMWFVGTVIMFVMGKKFLDQGLVTKSQEDKEE